MMLSEATHHRAGLLWDSLAPGPHGVTANILFFSRAVLSNETLCFDLYQWKLVSRFLSPPAPLLGPEGEGGRGRPGLWAVSSLAALLEQRGLIMQIESYLPTGLTRYPQPGLWEELG